MVWPPRRRFNAQFDHRTVRNPVAYYVNSLIDSIGHMRRVFWVRRVVLHAHPHARSLVKALGCVDQVVFCQQTDHWRYPVLARATSVLNEPSNDIVVMLDTHDDPAAQEELLKDVLEDMRNERKLVGITAWPTVEQFIEEIKPTQGETLPQHEIVGDGATWFIDCGLIVTKPAFRRRMPSYESFLRGALTTYDNVWTDFEATSDEALIDAFLFKSTLADFTARNASLRPHWLEARDSSTVPVVLTDAAPPRTWPVPAARGEKELVIRAQDTGFNVERLKLVALRWSRTLPPSFQARH